MPLSISIRFGGATSYCIFTGNLNLVTISVDKKVFEFQRIAIKNIEVNF